MLVMLTMASLAKRLLSTRRDLCHWLRAMSWRHQSSAANHDKAYKEMLTLMDRQFADIDIESFQEIIDNSTDGKIEKRIESILNEYEYEKQTSFRVPYTLTVEQMKQLLEMEDPFCRQKHLLFLYKRENMKKRQTEQRAQRLERKPRPEPSECGIWGPDGELIYGMNHNTLTQRLSGTHVKRLAGHRLRTAALFGPKLVIDLDFEKYMRLHETRLLLKQLSFLYNYNRYEAKHPFDLHFVNCRAEDLTFREMPRWLPKVSSSDFFVSMHFDKSYLDVFPKEKLVYLSPHSEEVLTSVSEDDVYIIGGLIDKSYREPISLIKAREDGIRSAKLPINDHLKWVKGSQHLCINQVLGILHDWKVTKNWKTALLNNIPDRKIMSEQEYLIESLRREHSHRKKIKISKYIK